MSSMYSLARWIPGANGRIKPIELPENAACTDFEGDGSLAHIFATSRERLGLTREAAAAECRLQLSYIEMMETGNYDAIPDLLYLLPSFRRYAEFLGLDAKEVTAIFLGEFEESESAALEIQTSAILRTVKRPSLRSTLAAGGLVGAAVLSIAAITARLEPRETSPHVTTAVTVVSKPATVSSPVVVAIQPPVPVTSNTEAQIVTRLAVPAVQTRAKPVVKAKAPCRTCRRSMRSIRRARSGRRHRRVSLNVYPSLLFPTARCCAGMAVVFRGQLAV
jgi:hypothetical protein